MFSILIHPENLCLWSLINTCETRHLGMISAEELKLNLLKTTKLRFPSVL